VCVCARLLAMSPPGDTSCTLLDHSGASGDSHQCRMNRLWCSPCVYLHVACVRACVRLCSTRWMQLLATTDWTRSSHVWCTVHSSMRTSLRHSTSNCWRDDVPPRPYSPRNARPHSKQYSEVEEPSNANAVTIIGVDQKDAQTSAHLFMYRRVLQKGKDSEKRRFRRLRRGKSWRELERANEK
jgi:hypothetical protein